MKWNEMECNETKRIKEPDYEMDYVLWFDFYFIFSSSILYMMLKHQNEHIELEHLASVFIFLANWAVNEKHEQEQ